MNGTSYIELTELLPAQKRCLVSRRSLSVQFVDLSGLKI